MKSQNCARLKLGLNAAMERLRAVPQANQDEVWAATSELLHWIYKCEEAEKKEDGGYFKDRELSIEGCTLAGLIWARGHVTHSHVEVQEVNWIPTEVSTFQDGKQIPVVLRSLQNGEWVPITVKRMVRQWPLRSNLPDQKADPHGRDKHYEKYVQGQDLLPPLELAIAYLLAR